MNFHFQQAIRALILLGFTVFIFMLHFTGEITKYINPKYEDLSITAAILFLVLFLIQLTRIWTAKEHKHHHCHHGEDNCCHHHDHGDTPFNSKKVLSYGDCFSINNGLLAPSQGP
nr:DUF1980 domain-containing protein [Bacillus sp. S/N-304-OC-R1]